MMLISDGNDWTRNTPRVEYPYIQRVYALYNAEHKVENVHFPAEKHDYGYSKRSVMYNFSPSPETEYRCCEMDTFCK